MRGLGRTLPASIRERRRRYGDTYSTNRRAAGRPIPQIESGPDPRRCGLSPYRLVQKAASAFHWLAACTGHRSAKISRTSRLQPRRVSSRLSPIHRRRISASPPTPLPLTSPIQQYTEELRIRSSIAVARMNGDGYSSRGWLPPPLPDTCSSFSSSSSSSSLLHAPAGVPTTSSHT